MTWVYVLGGGVAFYVIVATLMEIRTLLGHVVLELTRLSSAATDPNAVATFSEQLSSIDDSLTSLSEKAAGLEVDLDRIRQAVEEGAASTSEIETAVKRMPAPDLGEIERLLSNIDTNARMVERHFRPLRSD